MASGGSQNERSEALLVTMFNVCAAGQQQFDELLVSTSAGEGKGSVVVAICLRVHIHASGKLKGGGRGTVLCGETPGRALTQT